MLSFMINNAPYSEQFAQIFKWFLKSEVKVRFVSSLNFSSINDFDSTIIKKHQSSNSFNLSGYKSGH